MKPFNTLTSDRSRRCRRVGEPATSLIMGTIKQRSSSSCSSRRWRRWWFEPGILGHHSTKRNTDTLNDCEKYSASDGIVAHGFCSASYCKRSASHEAADDGVPWVLFLPTLVSTSFLVNNTSVVGRTLRLLLRSQMWRRGLPTLRSYRRARELAPSWQ
jgi:hypothetical protein